MASTRERPALHFAPLQGWVNDPVALAFAGGTYHLFFQAVPGRTEWDPACRWGHATSTDLITWQEHPTALDPGDGDEGCWSGSLVTGNGSGAATIFYTSVSHPDLGRGQIRLARPADATWTSWVKGPVVVPAPAGAEVTTFRDPCVVRDGDRWRMVVGAGLDDATAAALSYTSTDLEHWEYAGVLASRHVSQRDPVWTGSVWECPQLVTVEGVTFLVVSVWDRGVLEYIACATGELVDGAFVVTGWHRLTYGSSYYAGSTFSDAEGARGMMFWLRGVGDPEAGWEGALSVPHLATVQDGRLVLVPHPALSEHVRVWADPATEPVPDLPVRDGDDPIVLRLDEGLLSVTIGGPLGTERTMPYDGGPVQILLDHGVIEVFGSAGVLAVPT